VGSRRDPVDFVSNALFCPLVISLLQISQEGNCTCQIDVFFQADVLAFDNILHAGGFHGMGHRAQSYRVNKLLTSLHDPCGSQINEFC